MANASRPAPKEVQQDTSKFHCWAAALESWIASQKPATPAASMMTTQADIVSGYSSMLGAKDGLQVKNGVVAIAFDMHMNLAMFKPGSTLAAGEIATKLNSKGYIWCFYLGGPALGGFVGHAVVIYGIAADADGVHSVLVMDPWVGKNRPMPLSDLQAHEHVFFGWKESEATWDRQIWLLLSGGKG